MIVELLEEAIREHGFDRCIVGTEDGLLLGFSGDVATSEELAGFTSLFRGVVGRAERDIGMHRVDEVALLDPGRGRLVVRPMEVGDQRFFLVVQLPTTRYWRRATTALCRDLTRWLHEHTAQAQEFAT